MRKRLLFTLLIASAALGLASHAAAQPVLTSPDGRIAVALRPSEGAFGFSVTKEGRTLYTVDSISLCVDKKVLPASPSKAKIGKPQRIVESIRPVVPLKFSTIESACNELRIDFADCALVVRAMASGVAYRFEISKAGDVCIYDDHFRLTPAEGFTAHYQPAPSFNTSYEEPYRSASVGAWHASDRPMATVPLLLSHADDTQLLLGESDVLDYPRMFLRAEADGSITPRFPPMPLRWERRGDRSENILKEAPYVARTQGRRALPWRWTAITNSPGLLELTLPVELAKRNTLEDTSWIRPGQVAWEWWNGAAPYGPDVDFKAGCNFATYCYYADFAARYGLDYVLLDEGWAKSLRDPFHGNDELRLHELINYCRERGVKMMLWLPWPTVEEHLDSLFAIYASWGIEAVKIDFMDHADQWMVNFYERVVREAARHHIIVDFHGAFTPAGLEQQYPNLISYEGVRGLENGCPPDNTLLIPFIRNAVGAADFTPGGMFNMQPKLFRAARPNSGAQGTRAFQLALYVVLESGVQMLADSPTRYYQNDDCTRFIASVSTTWDETRALAAKAGEYAVVAKRKGEQWFIGAITNGTPRDLTLSLNFLDVGRYTLTAFRDGANADYQAMHYNTETRTIDPDTTLNIHLAPNGGWAARIEK
ncbi:MAG: glycoside hydrolase family 97 catalytic domain-containing protein [Alloprevotella sp.]|nr:glycoside hydrolase family 97 catalytic domain-containing protein [Alloprevotella sp.]